MKFIGKVVMKNSSITIANKYIHVLEKRAGTLQHRGAPEPSRVVTKYSDDPYNMSYAEYKRAKQRIKREIKEKNRAAQKKLNQTIIGALRRKPQKWLSYREKKLKELADLETKYRRAKIDREYGNAPGRWREDEKGKYPQGTQGKPNERRGLPPKTPPRRELPPGRKGYDYEGDWREVPEPRGHIEAPKRPTPPSRRELPPPRARRKELPPPRERDRRPEPKQPALPSPGRHIAGYLPPARAASTVAKRIKSRRGNRR